MLDHNLEIAKHLKKSLENGEEEALWKMEVLLRACNACVEIVAEERDDY